MASAETKQSIAELSDRLQNISLKPSDHVFVLKILTNDLIFEVIFDACTPATFFRISRTCRIAYDAVRFYVGRTFNINRHLSQYFPDPLAFRSLQARTAALISGSNALQFFNRLRYSNSDLDVYVSWKSAMEVGKWMLGHGYTYKPSVSQLEDLEQEIHAGHHSHDDYAEGEGISTVLLFVKPSKEYDTEKELQVHIIVSFRTPMEVIMKVHSSVFTHLPTLFQARADMAYFDSS
ncbi:hypothetical protein PHLCEN_2v3478 [Hermanssonia centrifuga]|uniref:F-box domain-containing protein n=1 Tax=Hermanssonia centrifuga TaxID=98765 RepID=A0A2R6QIN3_9APHY|nr:hypothetical protein PHLCEN_2v3478 [Hermanssonia centrifuga]